VGFWREFCSGNGPRDSGAGAVSGGSKGGGTGSAVSVGFVSVVGAVCRARAQEMDSDSLRLRMMQQLGQGQGHTSAAPEVGTGKGTGVPLRSWVRYSRVVYGLPNLLYSSSS
jgi:hypothetical protein